MTHSVVSKEASQVRHAGNSVIPERWLVNDKRHAVVAHLKNVADYIECSWWKWRGRDLILLDGQEQHLEGGPKMEHFRDKSSMQVH